MKTNTVDQLSAFDEIGYSRTINAYKKILASLNEIAEDYEKYGLGEFSDKVYSDILINRIKNIKAQYLDIVRRSIEKTKIASISVREEMITKAGKDMDAFEKKIDDFFSSAIRISGSTLNSNLPISIKNIKVTGNRASIESIEPWVKEQFTRLIKTENQKQAYALFADLKKGYDAFVDFLKGSGNDTELLDFSSGSLLYIDNENHLQLAIINIDQIQ